jgi:DNA-binding response OmpR family regulator
MILSTGKAEDIVLLAAPEKLGNILAKALIAADIRCIHTISAESCLLQVEKIEPVAILIDVDLLDDDCQQIMTDLANLRGRNIFPILFLAKTSELDMIKTHLTGPLFDVAFKPIRCKELIARIELIKDGFYKDEHGMLDSAQRKIVVSARKACHELNQPLQYIMGAIQLTLLDISSEDPVYKVMNGIRQQSERMAQVTIDLMHLIRSI